MGHCDEISESYWNLVMPVVWKQWRTSPTCTQQKSTKYIAHWNRRVIDTDGFYMANWCPRYGYLACFNTEHLSMQQLIKHGCQSETPMLKRKNIYDMDWYGRSGGDLWVFHWPTCGLKNVFFLWKKGWIQLQGDWTSIWKNIISDLWIDVREYLQQSMSAINCDP